jgi:hypothetical protein
MTRPAKLTQKPANARVGAIEARRYHGSAGARQAPTTRRGDPASEPAVTAPMKDNLDATPPVIKAMAATFTPHAMSSRGADMARRLLTDPKMQNVWRTLQRTPVKPYAMVEWQRLVDWPVTIAASSVLRSPNRQKMLDAGASPQDKGCAGFFYMLSFGGLNLQPPMWTRSELEERAAPLRSAAQMCRDEKRRLYEHSAA